MTRKQQRILVLKVLKAAQKNPPKGGIEELTDSIVSEFEAFEEAISEGGVIINTTPAPPPSQIILASESASVRQQASVEEDSTDIFRRTNSQPVLLSGDELTSAKVKIVEDLRVTLPKELSLQPPGFSSPIVLLRHTVGAAPGDMPYVEVSYVIPGAQTSQQLVRTFVDANKPRSAQSIIEEITQTSVLQFSATPKRVVAKSAGPPPMANWESESLNATIDKDLPGKAPQNWMVTQGDPFKL